MVLSRDDLLRAQTLRPPPDLFELRLDALAPIVDQIESAIRSFDVPLIITARHPREGGLNDLSAATRSALLKRFLDRAAYIDIELRAVRELSPIVRAARRKRVGLIVSFHDFNTTPSVARLRAKARAASGARADIFKIVTRTDTKTQLDRLLEFFDQRDVTIAISAMGIGKLGRIARLEFARRGSPLLYASVGRPRVAGQMSIEQLRSGLAALKLQPGTQLK